MTTDEQKRLEDRVVALEDALRYYTNSRDWIWHKGVWAFFGQIVKDEHPTSRGKRTLDENVM